MNIIRNKKSNEIFVGFFFFLNIILQTQTPLTSVNNNIPNTFSFNSLCSVKSERVHI